ncbi:response regulator receiver protein [Actinocorallia longicatena]|uniref:Response regulator receiver protein n=1 Tax=Actinocorallia longicatena TaxID=111803 RepID=A0ABP6Q6N7_9ACTN
MSSGVEAEIALDAAVIASLGMNRLLGAGAGAGASAAAAFARLADKKAGARAEELAEMQRYERALREVVDRNARIRALDAVQARSGTHAPLPEPLALDAQPFDALVTWCAAVDTALTAAEQAIALELAHHLTDELSPVSEPDDAVYGTRRDTAERQEHRAATETVRAAVPAPRPGGERRADVVRVLGRLLPDASPDDLSIVRAAAGHVVGAATDAEAEGLLSEVRLRVQEANSRTKAERGRVEALRAEEQRRAQAEAEREYILAGVTAAFEELGYEVDAGFETVTPMTLTRTDWPDQVVLMGLDEGTLRAKMMRTRPLATEEERRRDAEREREWCEAFEAARAKLERDGLGLAVTWRLEPGAESLPVGAESSRSRKKQKPRERNVEH